MNRLTLSSIMALLGAFDGTTTNTTERVPYPYGMGEKHIRVGRIPHPRKKGPGRRHNQGKPTPARHLERKLRTCDR